jgi:type IV secretory pathway TrbL component
MTDPLPAPLSGSWLSYTEAGERLGMSAEAVRTKARRAGWRRMPGNDGRTLVLVPGGADEQPPGRTPAHGALIETLREAIALLGEQLQAERSRADSDRAEIAAGRARADADRIEIVRLTENLAEKQAMAATAQAELAEQRARADKAEQTVRAGQETAEALRQADEARKARGRLRRAWDGWRGR